MCVPLSCLPAIWMAIIRSGWVLRPRIVIVLQPLALKLCLVVISWWSARPMRMVEHFNLLMTDVPDRVRVAVIARIGNSDHSSLSAVNSMAQAVPKLFVSKKVLLKHQVNWNTVSGAIQGLPWHNIWTVNNPVKVLNEHLSLLVGRYVPTKSSCAQHG